MMNPFAGLSQALLNEGMEDTPQTVAARKTGNGQSVMGFLSLLMGNHLGGPSPLQLGPVAPSIGASGAMPVPQVGNAPSAAGSQLDASPLLGIGDPVATDLPPVARSFLNAIAGPEAGGKYNVRYGGAGGAKTFEGSEHPRVFESRPDGRKSSAAGRYQFTASTWDATGGGAFDEASQDRRAWDLAQGEYKRRTGKDLTEELSQNGLTDQTLRVLGPTWEAFQSPGGRQSGMRHYKESLDRYVKAGVPVPEAVQTNVMDQIQREAPQQQAGLSALPIADLDQDQGYRGFGGRIEPHPNDRYKNPRTPEELYSTGLEALRKKFQEMAGIDYVHPLERFDDSPTEDQRFRHDADPTRPSINRLKGQEQRIEMQGKRRFNEMENKGSVEHKISYDPSSEADYLHKRALDPDSADTPAEEAIEMAVRLGLIRPDTAAIVMAGTVTPLPIQPGPNAGPPTLDQATAGQRAQPGSNILRTPPSLMMDKLQRLGKRYGAG
jgi:muramidase (phage lysozyme)